MAPPSAKGSQAFPAQGVPVLRNRPATDSRRRPLPNRIRLRGMEDRALRRGNASLAVLHAAQAAVILALSTDFSLPVTGAFMEGQPGSGVPKQDLLFDLRIGRSSAHSCC